MPEWYVSYAWGDDRTAEGRAREEVVGQLCNAAAARGYSILRDKEVLSLGDSISSFMRRMSTGDRVFVILSDKYLRSPHCMFELSEIWRMCRQEGEAFLERVRIYALPDTKIFKPADWVDWAIYWKREHDDLESRVRQHGVAILGEWGHRRLKQMHNFYTQVSDILGTLADIVQPRSFEELERYGLDDGEPDLDGCHSVARNFRTPPSLEAPDARNPAVYFQPGEVLARAGHPGEQEFRFPYEKAAYLRILPANQRPYPSPAKLLSVFQERKPCPMSEIRVGINSGRNRFGPIIYRLAEPEAPNNILSLTQSFETGELWGISAEIFDEPIPMVAFERLHVFVLTNYVNTMRCELNLGPPYSVELGLVGLKDVYLGLPGPTQPFGSKTAPSSAGPITKNSFHIRDTLGDISDSSIKNMLGAYFRHLYELAGYTRADALTDYTVSTWGLPPR